MSFDWQTEEDGEWEEQTWQNKLETAVQPKPPWRTFLVIVILLSVVGVVVYQQVNKRLDDATAAAESNIFASHNLLSRAAANQDADLGKAVLSGRDMGWSQTQSELVAAGLFYEPLGLGLTLASEEAAFAPLSREDERFVDLTLSPDLNGAELLYGRDFLAFTDDGMQPVTLQQTAVYRRGENRWLLAPPLEDFWGKWQTEKRGNINFIYPQRDEEVVSQLIDDLPALLEDVCAELSELNCSPDITIQIRFDTDPESLLESADPANLYKANLRLDLPTPTLVGLPINNDGYQALRNAYAAKLVAALISDSVAYECCTHAPMFQAVMIYQLSELGLTSWPVTQEVQQSLANSGVHTEMLFPYWSETDFALIKDENSHQLFGFIDFLLKQYIAPATPLWLMSQMNNSSRVYQSWLVSLNDEVNISVEMISRNWWFYALTQSEILTASTQPISLPAQDLQVGCLSSSVIFEDYPETTIYRFKLANESWVEEFSYSGLAFFNPLPQDDGVVLQLVDVSEEQYWQTLLWRNGTSVEIMNMNDVYSISLGQMDPNGRFLLSYFGSEEDESLPEPLLIDMESCQDGDCDSTLLGQTPYWSPNGQQMLLTDQHLFESGQYTVDGRIISLNPESFNQVSTLWLSDVQAGTDNNVVVGVGASPFWINNETFGFIRTAPDASVPVLQELVIASVNNLEPAVVLTTAVLTEAMPEQTGNPLLMRYAIAHPTNEDLLLVMASTQAADAYLFQVNRQTQAVELLFPLDLSRGEHSLGFSPDGRFLVATGTVQQGTPSPGRGTNLPFGALHLYNLESGEHQTILTNTDFFFPAFSFDWSLDGNWLAFARDNSVIGLIAPDYDYQQMILHEEGNCTSLSWVNPLPAD